MSFDLSDAGLPAPPERRVFGPEPGLDEAPLFGRGTLAESVVRSQRRERIATAVLAGFAAKPAHCDEEGSIDSAAEEAVVWADALIAELDK